jgi:hypothetical protein
MNIILVVTINNGVVDEAINCWNNPTLAEELFLRACHEIDDEKSLSIKDNITSILDDGYFEYNGRSVCLVHPQDVDE